MPEVYETKYIFLSVRRHETVSSHLLKCPTWSLVHDFSSNSRQISHSLCIPLELNEAALKHNPYIADITRKFKTGRF